MNPPKLVCITWDDACTDDGWQDHSAYKPTGQLICTTVGYLLNHDRTSIEVAQTWNEGQAGARWRIPARMIIAICELKVGRKIRC